MHLLWHPAATLYLFGRAPYHVGSGRVLYVPFQALPALSGAGKARAFQPCPVELCRTGQPICVTASRSVSLWGPSCALAQGISGEAKHFQLDACHAWSFPSVASFCVEVPPLLVHVEIHRPANSREDEPRNLKYPDQPCLGKAGVTGARLFTSGSSASGSRAAGEILKVDLNLSCYVRLATL